VSLVGFLLGLPICLQETVKIIYFKYLGLPICLQETLLKLYILYINILLFRNYPVALDLSKGIPCGVPLDLTVSCSAKRLSLHNKVRISLLVLLSSSI